MLHITLDLYFYLAAPIFSYFFYWYFFLQSNFFFIKVKPLFFDKLQPQNFNKKLNFQSFLNYGALINIILMINIFNTKGVAGCFFWSHLYVNNFNLNLIVQVLGVGLLCLGLLFFYSKIFRNIQIEYLFALVNINVTFLFLFLVFNLFSLFFFLELISIFIFYKFSVSKFWIKSSLRSNANRPHRLVKKAPNYYLNMLFFQYWSSFFSSLLILYAVITINLYYNSTDWFLLNLLFKINNNIIYFELKDFILILLPLIFGLCIKLGITPIHFYKLEIYKGLPFISIFFYTLYFFFIYFIFISLVVLTLMSSYVYIIWFFLVVFLLLGFFYLIFFLFNNTLTKSFFAISSVINSLNFMILIITSI